MKASNKLRNKYSQPLFDSPESPPRAVHVYLVGGIYKNFKRTHGAIDFDFFRAEQCSSDLH